MKALSKVQFDFGTGKAPFDNDTIRKRRQGAVKDAFKRNWDSCRKRAWKQDELTPISGSAKATFGCWGAKLVDSLDTLWIMGFMVDFEEVVQAVSQIEFNPGVGELNLFETLEFTRLTQIAGDKKYYDAVMYVATVVAQQQQLTRNPGLWPAGVNVYKPDLTKDTSFSLGTMTNSAYEYLSNTYQLPHSTSNAGPFAALYMSAMDAVATHLLFRPATPDADDIFLPTSARVRSDGSIEQDHSVEHPACFAGGMPTLGGRLFGNSTPVVIGSALTDGYIWAYLNAFNGIVPESSTMTPCASNSASLITSQLTIPPCTSLPGIQQLFSGFTHVTDTRYQLRPEAIESLFYTHQLTGAHVLQDTAWRMFDAVNTLAHTDIANAAVEDVTLARGKTKLLDGMESFWLAEALKYFWLMFA